jgi:hypothetical protein
MVVFCYEVLFPTSTTVHHVIPHPDIESLMAWTWGQIIK